MRACVLSIGHFIETQAGYVVNGKLGMFPRKNTAVFLPRYLGKQGCKGKCENRETCEKCLLATLMGFAKKTGADIRVIYKKGDLKAGLKELQGINSIVIISTAEETARVIRQIRELKIPTMLFEVTKKRGLPNFDLNGFYRLWLTCFGRLP